MSGPVVSVCIATCRTGPPLLACLDSLAAQVDAPTFELLVCADDPDVVTDVRQRFAEAAFAFVSTNGRAPVSPSDKRNMLLARAQGEWLLFLDDDVVADPQLLQRLAAVADEFPDAGALGGPNLTPAGSTEFQVVQGAVLGSFIGAGPVRRKWGAHPAGPADERYFTLCNLAIRRSAMVPFPPGLVAGEENAVLNELHRQGVAMRYDPALAVSHQRRVTLSGFAAQIRKFATGRGRIIGDDRSNLRPVHLLPVALLTYLALLPVLAAVSLVALVPFCSYLLAMTAQAGKIAVSFPGRRIPAGLRAFGLLFVVHACYGIGLVSGLASHRPAPAPFSITWLDVLSVPKD